MLQTHTVRLKLADADSKALGVSHLAAAVVTCAEGLIEGEDFEIDRERGTIRRLREFGRELYTFTCAYDDQSEARTAEKQAEAADRDAVRTAIASLTAYANATSATNAQTVAAVRLLCRVCIILIRRALGVRE